MDHSWPHHDDPVQFRRWLFDRLRALPDIIWDETRSPTHTSHSEWHTWGSIRTATTPSAASDSPSSPSRSSFSSRPSTPRQSSSDSIQSVSAVLARISRRSLNLERQWQISKSMAKVDPRGRNHLRALQIYRLPARDSHEPSLTVILYEDVGANCLRDYTNFGPNWYVLPWEVHSNGHRPEYEPTLSANRNSNTGKIHLPAFMDFAIGASVALATIHKANIVHAEIRGDSFHYCGSSRAVRLAHLGNGSRTIEGSLTSLGWNSFSREPGVAYRLQFVAPEQTGRTNSPIDARTDIYRLGIFFWNLLTGELPFPEDNPLTTIQNAFTRRVPPVTTRRLDVPDALSLVISKMVSKNSIDRYHSAAGLEWDLSRIQQHLIDGDSDGLMKFQIGSRDVNSAFVLPSILVGREEETKILTDVIDRVAASRKKRLKLGLKALPSSGSNSSRSSISTQSRSNMINGSSDRTLNGNTSPAQSVVGSASFAMHRMSIDLGVGGINGDFSSRTQSIPSTMEGESGFRPSAKFKRKGACELIVVSGAPGVGKSNLVASVLPAARAEGYCATTKVVQGSSTTPFEPCIRLLANIVQQMFSESDVSTEFHDALRSHMRPKWKYWAKLLDLPKWLLEYQASADASLADTTHDMTAKDKPRAVCKKTAEFYRSGTANKSSRFMSSFVELMRFIADRKLIFLCLEELQYADEETVSLLEKLVSGQVPLILVVTTREETATTARRERTLAAAKHAHVNRIDLRTLTEDHVSRYIVETLKRPAEYCFPLCAVIFSQSRGNMFCVKEMLNRCHQTGAISYSFESANWVFDLDTVFKVFTSKEYSAQIDDNYIRKRMLELSPSAVSLLKWASLLGPSFSFTTVKHLLEQDSAKPNSRSVTDLSSAPRFPGKVDLIRASSHDAVRALQEALGAYIIEPDSSDDKFRWSHVRFKQTAQGLCGEDSKEMHFKIAELFITGTRDANQSVWAKAWHTHEALDLIRKSVTARRPYRNALYEAGNAAIESNSRAKAMKFWSCCLMLLQPKPWDESQPDVDYQETLLLYSRCAESYFFLGHIEPARGLLSTLMKQAKDAVDKVPACILSARISQQRGDGKGSFRILCQCLQSLGMSVVSGTWEEFDKDLLRMIERIKQADRAELAEQPQSDDRTVTMMGAVLCEATGVAYWGNPLLFAQLGIHELEMHLSGRVSSQAGLGYIHIATLAIGRFNMVDFGCDIAMFGLQLLHKFSADQFSHGRGWTLFHNVAGHICLPINRVISEMSLALDDCIRGGDPASAMLNVGLSAGFRFLQIEDISEVEAFCNVSAEDLHPNWRDDIRGQSILAIRQWCRVLQGKTSHNFSDGRFFSDDSHDSVAYEENILPSGADVARQFLMYNTWKLSALFLFGHTQEAVDLGTVHHEQVDMFWSSVAALTFRFYFALAELGLALDKPDMPEEQKKSIIQRAEKCQAELTKYSTKGNPNYGIWQHVIAAQLHEIDNRFDLAVCNYEHAQDCAEIASLRFEYALSTEMAAEFLIRRGANRLARASLQEAVGSYRRVAAWAKADQVTEKYELLLRGCSSLRAVDAGVQTSTQSNVGAADESAIIEDESATHGMETLSQIPTQQTMPDDGSQRAPSGLSGGLDVLDFQSILHSSQILASELDFDKLIQQMTRIILDSTGAWLCGLVQQDQAGEWVLANLSDSFGKDWSDQIGLPLKDLHNELAKNLTINALRYKEKIVVRNTNDQSRFAVNDTERARHPQGKSVVVMPVLRGDEIAGAVYLEGHSFTERSISVLSLLVNAFAIAITNSKLFKEVEKVSANNAVMVESQREALEKARKSEQKAKLAEAEAMRNVKLKEEAAKAKSMFLANVSHELRTPLNGVIGMSELLKGSNLTQEQEGFADSIRVCADTLLTVINDILDYSKLEAGKMQIFKCELSLYETINEVVRALSYSNVEKKLETIVKLDLDPDALVMGDPVRLHQVLMNLMSNSYKFTERGTITVSAEVLSEDDKEVSVSISVADTGVGITEEQRTKLFLPFSQADSSTARSYGGTGLGLSICKAIIEGVMKGKIELESQYGLGTKVSFTITLQKASGSRRLFKTTARAKDKTADPMAQYSRAEGADSQNSGQQQKVVARQDLASLPRDSIRVAVAEDNPVNQKIAIAFVKKVGCACEAYDNGREAVDALHRASEAGKPFHIVLMDVQMPILDGYDATREIRKSSDKAVREVLVIAMTASAIKGDREKCLESGMDSYLAKPVRQQVLKDTLERYILATKDSNQAGLKTDLAKGLLDKAVGA